MRWDVGLTTVKEPRVYGDFRGSLPPVITYPGPLGLLPNCPKKRVKESHIILSVGTVDRLSVY